MDTWEKAEGEMQRRALTECMKKAGVSAAELDAVIAGDLQNQCTASSGGLVSFGLPFIGIYGACSTAAESMAVASVLCGTGSAERCAAVTSSHNCAAERQFRLPLEYGGQRPPTAQWTVTGAAAFIIDSERCGEGGNVRVSEVMFGRAVDSGVTDANNMGAAMAPAAADAICRYFSEGGDDADIIITGDLGREGASILKELTLAEGFDISENHTDCGMMIYDIEGQDKHCGGSGCACSGIVMAADIIPNLRRGTLGSVIFVGTGALMSPTSVAQGCSIAGVAHLVRLETVREK
jgi:stage V sporulation protein AD